MNIKHRSTQADKDRVEAHIDKLLKQQGLTRAQLYAIVPSVAERAKLYTPDSKWGGDK